MSKARASARYAVFNGAMAVIISSCSLFDISNPNQQDWLIGAVPAVSSGHSETLRKQAPTKNASRKEAPGGLLFLINVLRAPFVPIGAAVEIFGAGLEGTVGKQLAESCRFPNNFPRAPAPPDFQVCFSLLHILHTL